MRRLALFPVVLLTLFGCTQANPPRPTNPDRPTFFQGDRVQASQAVFAGDADRVRGYFTALQVDVDIEVIDADANVFLVRFPSSVALGRVIADLRSQLDFIEPHYLLTIDDAAAWPRDPEFINLWGLANFGQNAPGGVEGTPRADMQVLEAWQKTTGNAEIVVGVIDTGIDFLHPDLRQNIWKNPAELNGSLGVDDDKNGYIDDVYGWDFATYGKTDHPLGQPGDNDPQDDHGHGTHCAGTIAAGKDNNVGIVGVAPNVRLMALKSLNENGEGSSVEAYRAIRYGTEQGAHILSNSYGGGAKSQLVESAIRQAEERGVLFVAAAGNNGRNTDNAPHYPAGYDLPNVVSVGASDNNDRPAEFSNFGESSVDVFAPGVNILSTAPSRPGGRSPYVVMSGTSMATPHVAGLAALVMSADPAMRKNPRALRERLIASSDPVRELVGRSVAAGRVNAVRAVAGQVNPPVADELVFEAHEYQSPAFPTVLTDDRHTITKKGARAIKVHISLAQIDEPYDSVWIYDGQNRVVMHLGNGELVDTWTPLVTGDTVTLRFVNSAMRQVSKKWEPFATSEEGFAKGSLVCRQELGRTDWECAVDGPTVDYFSFNSEGYRIDQIAYLPAK